jgi:prepilin-type N-terminal cleavage/methylation domain-containing protein
MKASAKTRISTAAYRPAFTLLETLVALALLGMIMASVSASIDLYWKYRTISRDRISAAQILRGVMEDLTCDLRSGAAPQANASASRLEVPDVLSSGPGATGNRPQGSGPSVALPPGLERTLRVQEQQLNLSDSGTTPLHFAGSANWIALLTHSDNPRFATNRATYNRAEPRHVVWWWNDGSSVRVPLTQKGRQISISDLSAPDQPHGLVRVVKPFADNQTSEKQKTTVLVSDKVSAVRFRYFDGFHWHAEWNSATSFSIPRAVEVSLTLDGQSEPLSPFIIWVPQG